MVKVSLPFGDLAVPEGDSPLLLASAGIGITPMLSLLDHLADASSGRRVTVVHADRSPAHHAHRLELDDLVGRLPHATPHRTAGGPPSGCPPSSRHTCGPAPLRGTVADTWCHRTGHGGTPARLRCMCLCGCMRRGPATAPPSWKGMS
ncbi:hypothetical protein [Streptomyces griseoloalbus]|uniref:hypothetical protein n=2 Tax=Streptomyces griseoloalbus TaxID=67303 RepID=UPI0035E421C3